jgi:hypothetical protein
VERQSKRYVEGVQLRRNKVARERRESFINEKEDGFPKYMK